MFRALQFLAVHEFFDIRAQGYELTCYPFLLRKRHLLIIDRQLDAQFITSPQYCLSNTSYTSRTHNCFELHSCTNVKQNISLTYSEITFCKLPSSSVQISRPLRRHLRNTHVFLPSCALNIRSLSSTAASPEVHRNRSIISISSYRGVHSILSVVFCTLHTPCCGLLQTTKQYPPL